MNDPIVNFINNLTSNFGITNEQANYVYYYFIDHQIIRRSGRSSDYEIVNSSFWTKQKIRQILNES